MCSYSPHVSSGSINNHRKVLNEYHTLYPQITVIIVTSMFYFHNLKHDDTNNNV